MWKIFQRWSRLNEVFILIKLNRWDSIFGFVRFFEVKNVGRLKKELDSIRIGNMKLHVNLLRCTKGYVSEGAKEDRRNSKVREPVRAKAKMKCTLRR